MVRVEDRMEPMSQATFMNSDEDEKALRRLLDTQRQRRRRRHQDQCDIIRQLTDQLQQQNERLSQAHELRRDVELRLERMRDDKRQFKTAYRCLRYKMASTACHLKLDTTPDGGCLEVMCDCLRL